METKYIKVESEKEYNLLEEPAKSIKDGKLVVFPTETVYGIGANALDSKAVSKIFIAKGREQDNPLIVHISSIDNLKELVKDIGTIESKLMKEFWPGPLTIIFNKTNIIPYSVTAGLETVAIRMPSNNIAREIIKKSGVPIAAPSANISGKPSGTIVGDIFEELNKKVDYIIDGGMTSIGLESTVVRVIKDEVHILRPGKITEYDIKKLGVKVVIEKHILNQVKDKEKVMSPGMKYRHYAPNTKCLLIYSKNNEEIINKINKVIRKNINTVVLAKTKNMDRYETNNKLDMGDNLEDISKNIFRLLRKADKCNAELIVIEGVEKEGLGLAIMNRLLRACEYNYIEI